MNEEVTRSCQLERDPYVSFVHCIVSFFLSSDYKVDKEGSLIARERERPVGLGTN